MYELFINYAHFAFAVVRCCVTNVALHTAGFCFEVSSQFLDDDDDDDDVVDNFLSFPVSQLGRVSFVIVFCHLFVI